MSYYLQGRWILRGADRQSQKIVGRVYGQPGAMVYQLATDSYDEQPVFGHQDETEAFDAAVAEMRRRAVQS